MSNDFLPAIVSVGILVGVFLFAWISEVLKSADHSVFFSNKQDVERAARHMPTFSRVVDVAGRRNSF
jgi:xanthosine utilization system XapX-like protein